MLGGARRQWFGQVARCCARCMATMAWPAAAASCARGRGPACRWMHFRARTGLIAPHLQTDYPRHYSVRDTVVSGLHSSIGLNYAHRRRTPAGAGGAALAGHGVIRRPAAGGTVLWTGAPRAVRARRGHAAAPAAAGRAVHRPECAVACRSCWRWLEGRIAAGVTVVMATHYRSEWPRNATHELHLSRGRVAYAGKL